MKWDSQLYDNRHCFVSQYGEQLLDYVPVNKAQRILDLGCGTGILTERLAQRCGYVLGVDASLEMVEKARKDHPDIEFQVADAMTLEYQRQWDVVFSNAVFHWISDHDLLLGRIGRSLNFSGLLICEFGGHGNIQTLEQSFSDALCQQSVVYRSKFNFPTTQTFGWLLRKNGFLIETIYDYDRPTPLSGGWDGLRRWMMQFFEPEMNALTPTQRDDLVRNIEDRVREKLWNGQEWVIDYRRLRAVARAGCNP